MVTALGRGQTETALNVLGAFINQVQALVSEGVLSPSEGHALLAVADVLRELIDIGSGSTIESTG